MAQKKTVLNTQETPIIQKPTGVDTTGVQKTPELMATQKVSTFTPAPVAGLDGQFKTTADITAHKVNVNPQDAFNKARERGLAQMARNPQPGETPPPTGPFDTGNGEMSDGTTKTPTAETPPTTPPTTAEKTTVTTPEGTTTTTTETPKPTAITKDTNWQDVQNKDLNSLEQLVEQRYATVASQKDGKLIANINGENYEWSIQNGQPVKTKVQDPVTTGLLNKYITASSDEIYNGFINGEIPSSIETQITSNPNYAIAKEKYRKKVSADNTNKITETVFNAITGVEPTVKDKYQEASDKIVERERAKGKTDAEIIDYASFLGEDKELTRYTEDLNAKNKQYNELQNIAQNNAKNIMKANPGITETSAILLAARQNEPLNQQMESLSYEIQNLQANINYREKINEVAYNERQQLAQEQRQFDRTLELQKQQQLLQTGDLNSTDPYIQQRGIENAVNQLYSQYPIPGMESPTAKIEKVKQMIAQGMTPQQAISQLEQEIRATDRYKNYINPPVAQTESWQKLSDNSLYNQATGEVKNVGGTGMTANVSVQTDPQSIISYAINKQVQRGKIKAGETKIQCGQLTNSYIEKLTGTYGTAGDTLESKNADLERLGLSDVPVVGGLYTWDVGTKEGHIGIIQSVNGNQITVLEANKEGKEEGGEPVIETYTINDKMRFSQAPKSQPQYTDSDIELLSELANMDASARNTALKAQGIPLSAVTDYMALAKAGKIPPTESQKQSAMGIMSNIQGISELDWNDAIGRFDPTRVIGTEDATDAGVLIENLRDAAALNNLGMLKGPMSDKDIVFLKSVSSKLDPLQSNKQFEKNIVEMYNIAANKAGMPTITKLSEIPKERILPGQGGTQTGTQTQGETLAPGIDPMGKVPTKQGEFTNQDLLDTYNKLLKDNTPQEVDQYFSEYFGIPITR